MSTLQEQIQSFSMEVLELLDTDAVLSIDDFIEKMDDGSIVDFIHNSCPIKNINFNPDTATLLRSALKDLYVSENEARNRGITNNGLVYLVNCLMELLHKEWFELYCSIIG